MQKISDLGDIREGEELSDALMFDGRTRVTNTMELLDADSWDLDLVDLGSRQARVETDGGPRYEPIPSATLWAKHSGLPATDDRIRLLDHLARSCGWHYGTGRRTIEQCLREDGIEETLRWLRHAAIELRDVDVPAHDRLARPEAKKHNTDDGDRFDRDAEAAVPSERCVVMGRGEKDDTIRLTRAETKYYLRVAGDALTSTEQVILKAVDVNGERVSDLAEEMKMSAGQIIGHLEHARRKLAEASTEYAVEQVYEMKRVARQLARKGPNGYSEFVAWFRSKYDELDDSKTKGHLVTRYKQLKRTLLQRLLRCQRGWSRDGNLLRLAVRRNLNGDTPVNEIRRKLSAVQRGVWRKGSVNAENVTDAEWRVLWSVTKTD